MSGRDGPGGAAGGAVVLAAAAAALLLLLPVPGGGVARAQAAGGEADAEQPPFSEEQEQAAEAKLHFEEGIELYRDKDWEAALKEFKGAFALKAHWKIRYNIGLCHLKLQQWGEAMMEMSLMLQEGGAQVTPAQEKKVRAAVDFLKDKVGTLVLEGDYKKVDIIVDDKQAGDFSWGFLYLSAGSHVVDVKHQNKLIMTQDVQLAAGEEKTLAVKAPPDAGQDAADLEKQRQEQEKKLALLWAEEQKKNRTVTVAVLGGLAAAALAAGMGCGIEAILKKGEMKDTYDAYMKEYDASGGNVSVASWEAAKNDIDASYRVAKSASLASTVLLAAGGALAVAALTFGLLPAEKKQKGGKKSARALTIAPSLAPGAAGLALGF